jgi:cellulose synthase/poly-beta-1,6-N-acetylglucosamine synthase-like glycosyltransferase
LVSGEILHLLFYLLTGIPAATIAFYGVAILVYFNKNPKKACNNIDLVNTDRNNFDPFVSIVVATHNEEVIISKKIDNLLSSDYPADKIEIIFADDSDDSTPQIILKAAKKLPNIRLLRFNERIGYSPSMLAGCKAAVGEIIILNDAGSFMDPHAISKIVCRFQDPKIGVVTGTGDMLNVNEETGKSENLYLRLINILRISESNMDSTFRIQGETTGVRKILLEDIEANETFDTTSGLHARKKGYKVIFDPEVRFSEYAPKTRSDSIKQKTIRAANLISVLWRFRSMFFKRKYGKYGSLILPFNFAFVTIFPIFILFWFLSLSALTFLDVEFFVYVWGILGIVFLFLLVFSRRLLLTFLQFEYSLIKAIFQVVFVRKSHDKIDVINSTRRC